MLWHNESGPPIPPLGGTILPSGGDVYQRSSKILTDMELERYNQIVSRFPDLTVLVVGDVMLDTYVWGQAERISPEAPVPVIQVQRVEKTLGGAANVALNIRSLKAQVAILGVVGDDPEGQSLGEILASRGIDSSGIVTDRERSTTVKSRIIAHNQQVVRMDLEDIQPLSPGVEEEFSRRLTALLPRVAGVILADYDKGVLNPTTIELILELAQNQGVPVYVDPKKDHFFAYTNLRLLKPNQHEFEAALGADSDPGQFEAQGEKLRRRVKAEVLLVTLGEQGLALFTERGYQSIPTRARRVHDVSGAGDTVVATFSLADLAGAGLEEAALLSNYAAGRVCEEVGVVPITLAKLTEMVEHHNQV